MNQKIEALIRKTGIKFEWDSEDGSVTSGSVNERTFEELVKLTVEECMHTITDQTTLDTNEDFREGFSHGRKLAWQEIRNNFGMREPK